MSDLKQIITRKTLREEAGSTYFGRGLDYFKSGYVKKLEVHGNRIEGSVRGSRLYHCSIECDIDADSLFGECSCPLGDDGEFCKHLVALGLAFINGFETPAPSRKQPDFKLAKFLRERSREELVALLNGASKQYPDLLEYFRMSYLPAASEALQKELTLKIDRLLELAEECDYEDCYDYDEQYKIEQDEERLRQELKQLTDTMERMFSGTHAAMVMELAEYAIKEAVRRDLQSEDSCAGLISEMLSFYFKAVKKGLGKAADVAENMIEWEPLDSWGAMSQVGRYFMDAPARIEKAWNTAALHLWRKMPVLGMKDQRMTSTQRAIIEKRLLQYAPKSKQYDKIPAGIPSLIAIPIPDASEILVAENNNGAYIWRVEKYTKGENQTFIFVDLYDFDLNASERKFDFILTQIIKSNPAAPKKENIVI